MTLLEAVQQRRRNTEDAFFAQLMRHGFRSQPEFDTTGKTPKYLGGLSKMPSKTQLWNQYVALKKGRISTQDLMMFEQYYRNAKAMHQESQFRGLQKLSLQGDYTPKQITSMVQETPELYNNLLDMVSDLESKGDEEGLAAGETIRQFLPNQQQDAGGILGTYGDDKMDIPEMVAPPGAAYLAHKAYKWGKDVKPGMKTSNWKQMLKKMPKSLKFGAPAAAYMLAEPAGEYLYGDTGKEIARHGVNIASIGTGLGMLGKTLVGAPVKSPLSMGIGGLALLGGGLIDYVWGE
jgi:hypothetical protein